MLEQYASNSLLTTARFGVYMGAPILYNSQRPFHDPSKTGSNYNPCINLYIMRLGATLGSCYLGKLPYMDYINGREGTSSGCTGLRFEGHRPR